MSKKRITVSEQSKEPKNPYIWALKDVTFDIKRGEVVGFIGRNGAGKSTLLKVLSRITEPTEGYAEVFGRVGSLLEVGTGFHPELTGRENVYLNGAILGMKKADIDRKFSEIVNFSGVEKFIDTPLKRYSSGMQVRLAFSVAAHLEPEILLVDEVLAVGDIDFQKKSIGRMQEVRSKGRTVIFVSHNLASIANLCDRVILLEAGRIIANGSVSEVIGQYLKKDKTEMGAAAWNDPSTAPGNERVRLKSVRIYQDNKNVITPDVDISKDINIEISFWNFGHNLKLYSNIWLTNEMGIRVLSSTNHRSISLTPDQWSSKEYPKGLYRSVCTIPGNFLNDGQYNICAIIGKDNFQAQVLAEDVVSFLVHDTGRMSKEYTGSWKGVVVRPLLAWHTDLLDPNAG
ncbi:MAG: ABC transporter ATP-binding protein [Paludibacter sp.]|nr:ABC transporter ATP-binding protein [Paludibacter sp.]